MKKKKLYALPARYHARNHLTAVSGELSAIRNTQLRAEKSIAEHTRIVRHMVNQLHEGNERVHRQIDHIRNHEFPWSHENIKFQIERNLRTTNQTVEHIDNEIDCMKWSFPLLQKNLTVNMLRIVTATFFLNALMTTALLWLMR
ncbi:hypothetical protein RX799_24735 [Klebsiella oxytoca]|uniref:hypothetical protein n=1 Tax=Klebsiella oxytoca TaxID=571 RepID=UPI00384E3327